MKLSSIVLFLFLLASAPFVMAQRRTSRKNGVEPPALNQVSVETNGPAQTTLADIVAVTPQIPRGPLDVLREYRDQMTFTAQKLSAELATISLAVRNGQATSSEAEYLIQQRFQLAAMQYEVLSALYDSLAYDVARTARGVGSRTPARSDSAVVVQIP